jgi:hypothetical protein
MTTTQAKAALELIIVAGQLVASHGAQGMPSGHLYAHMMNAFSDVNAYESMVAMMVRVGAITKRGDLLISTVL